MRQFKNKNSPQFKNDLKWPTFRTTVKVKIIYMNKRHKVKA